MDRFLFKRKGESLFCIFYSALWFLFYMRYLNGYIRIRYGIIFKLNSSPFMYNSLTVYVLSPYIACRDYMFMWELMNSVASKIFTTYWLFYTLFKKLQLPVDILGSAIFSGIEKKIKFRNNIRDCSMLNIYGMHHSKHNQHTTAIWTREYECW